MLGEDADMKFRRLPIFVLGLFALLLSVQVRASVIIIDEHLEQQSSLTVLGNTFTDSYSGSLQMLASPMTTFAYVGLLYETDPFGFDRFSGITPNTNAPNEFAYMFSRANFYWDLGNYSFWLDSTRSSWLSAIPELTPELEEAYYHFMQDAFVELTVRFRVDGDQDFLRISTIFPSNAFPGDISFNLYDHTSGAGVTFGETDASLQDGHVYTMTALGRNSVMGEADFAAGVHFDSDSVVVAEPPVTLLLLLSLISLFAVRNIDQLKAGANPVMPQAS